MGNRNTQEIDDAVSLAGERVEKGITTLQQQVDENQNAEDMDDAIAADGGRDRGDKSRGRFNRRRRQQQQPLTL